MLFQRRDIEAYTDSLAAYLPGGELFASRNIKSSNFRNLLRGLAGELFSANGLIKEYNEEIIPDLTNKFLEEWESALGIPDSCFAGAGTIDERRRDVLVKLASLGVQTTNDFVELAGLFGIPVTVTPGIDTTTPATIYPTALFDNETDARFSIIVEFLEESPTVFPYTYPIVFGDGGLVILECLFTKLKPANCVVIFQQA